MESDEGPHGQKRPYPKKRRVRTGCLTCRQRKVKCGEESPKCHTCARLDLDCIYGDPLGSQEDKPPTIRRTRKACDQCRAVKAGCSNDRPTCARCLALGKTCVYPVHTSPDVTIAVYPQRKEAVLAPPPDISHLWTHTNNGSDHATYTGNAIEGGWPKQTVSSPSKHGTSDQDGSPLHAGLLDYNFETFLSSKYDLYTFLDAYWEKVYNASWYSFLHRPSFMTALDSNNVPTVLVQSMCGAAACFLEPNSARAAGWMEQVETEIYGAFKAPTLELLQACLNLIFYDYVNGNGTRTYMITGFAARMSYALGLSTETNREDLSFGQKESRRRLMWSLYSIDAMVSGGVREIECVPLDSLHIQLPCNERNFNLSIPCKTRKLHRNITPDAWVPDNTEGLFTQVVTLLIIRKKVMSYVINLARDSSLPWEDGSMFDQCRWLLHHWRQGLGPEIQFTAQNIAARRTGKQINQLFGVHARYWGITYNLFRIAVHGFVEAAGPEVLLAAPHGWLRSIQRECFHAATQVSELCITLLQIFPDYIPEDCSIPVTLYEALRIQAWALDNLVAVEDQYDAREQARIRINSTVEIMIRGEKFHAGSRRLRPTLEELIARTQLRNIITRGDLTTSQYWKSEKEDPLQKHSAFGNISKTHLIHAVEEELANIKPNNSKDKTSGSAGSNSDARPLPERSSKQEPEAESQPPALPPLPIPDTWSNALNVSNYLQPAFSPVNTDLNWLLNPNEAILKSTVVPNVNGPPVQAAADPYDDIAAMLSWQWPTAM